VNIRILAHFYLELKNVMGITIGLLIALLGTMLCAAFVFFMKKGAPSATVRQSHSSLIA